MKYNGIELKEFTSDRAVLFDPPKRMLVWNFDKVIVQANIVAYIPGYHQGAAVGDYGRYDHCAEIPEEPKPKRMTNRQLAEWLAKGNGEKKRLDEYEKEDVVFASIEFTYELGDADLPVDECYFIRRWNETEWHEPTVDFFDKDCKELE